jgi:putative transposase
MGNPNQSNQSNQSDELEQAGRKYLPPIGGAIEKRTPWPHAPTHMLSASGTYFVTTGTYLKRHHFRAPERRSVLQLGLMTVARDFGWAIEAWAIFANHYHFVAHSPAEGGAQNLSQMLGVLHKRTATWVNRLDGEPGRKVWHNFRETRLTYQKSYLARLNYTHQNPVKHGLVRVANQYPWCSAGWLEQTAPPGQVKTIYSFGIQRVRVYDDFDVESEEWET